MIVDNRQLEQWEGDIEKLIQDLPGILDKLVVGEGVYAVKQARLICKNDNPDIVNSGDYRKNFKSDPRSERQGKDYVVKFYNNLNYAIHLEYGFRSHFVPGHWAGYTFVYQRNDPEGGMYVGRRNSFVPGHYTLRRAETQTSITQKARLKRKWDAILRQRLEG